MYLPTYTEDYITSLDPEIHSPNIITITYLKIFIPGSLLGGTDIAQEMTTENRKQLHQNPIAVIISYRNVSSRSTSESADNLISIVSVYFFI